MLARDLMTKDVAAVAPETPLRDIARLLLDRGISAVPVVDATGAPIGIVSEGDLIGRNDSDRLARRDWWLAIAAGAEGPELFARADAEKLCARDVMTAPVVSVSETTEAAEIARLLSAYHIKRVPVLRDGRITGIVSRADLLRALAAAPAPATAPSGAGPLPSLIGKTLSALDQRFLHGHEASASSSAPPQQARAEGGVSVADFRALIADHERALMRATEAKQEEVARQRRDTVRALIDQHIADAGWKSILQRAREAAAAGEKELEVLRFPSTLCEDGGRAINAPLPDWPKTLRGEAAEIYLRWERELKPRGFHLSARVLDFPGGKPGDIGLFLVWGE